MRDANSIWATIFEAHQREVGNELAGIVLCGGIGAHRMDSASNDVDFVVVLDELTSEGLEGAARARETIDHAIGFAASNTVITRDEVYAFTDHPAHLDGKATQALIEAAHHPHKVLVPPKRELTIELPSDELVSQFSLIDLRIIGRYLRKTITRAGSVLSPFDRHKVAKGGMIAVKMQLQAVEPRRFSDPSDTNPLDVPQDHPLSEVLEFLRGVRGDPEGHSSNEVVSGIAALLRRAREDMMEPALVRRRPRYPRSERRPL